MGIGLPKHLLGIIDNIYLFLRKKNYKHVNIQLCKF